MYPYIIGAILIAIDQIIKAGVLKYLAPIDTKTIIPGILNFTYTENRGVAFGMFSGGRVVFVLLTIAILLAVVWMIEKSKFDEPLFTLLLTMILGGAAGNLIDRIRLGFVVDFVHFNFFPYIFNFADSCVVLGAIILGVYVSFFDKGNALLNGKGKI